MTRKSLVIGAGIAAALTAAASGFGSSAIAQTYEGGRGMMGGGYGMMAGYGRGDGVGFNCPGYQYGGMRGGRGYGPGWMHGGRGSGAGYGRGWMHRGGPGYGPGYGRDQ